MDLQHHPADPHITPNNMKHQSPRSSKRSLQLRIRRNRLTTLIPELLNHCNRKRLLNISPELWIIRRNNRLKPDPYLTHRMHTSPINPAVYILSPAKTRMLQNVTAYRRYVTNCNRLVKPL